MIPGGGLAGGHGDLHWVSVNHKAFESVGGGVEKITQIDHMLKDRWRPGPATPPDSICPAGRGPYAEQRSEISHLGSNRSHFWQQ